MSTEEMIKQAFDRQAERTPNHYRSLAVVRERTASPRRVSSTRLALIAAAAAVAIIVPTVALSGEQPTSPAASAGLQVDGTVLKYEPSWLPDGVLETSRTASLKTGELRRAWSRPTGDKRHPPYVLLAWGRAGTVTGGVDGDPRPITVGGVEGVLRAGQDDRHASVEWSPATGGKLVLVVQAGDGPDPTATALATRVAQSVRSTGTLVFEESAKFGWLPSSVRPVDLSMARGGATPPTMSLIADLGGPATLTPRSSSGKPLIVEPMTGSPEPGPVGPPPARVHAWIGATSPRPASGTSASVRGLSGSIIAPSEDNTTPQVRVQLADGRWLVVSGTVPVADLKRIADELDIKPASNSWPGK